MQAAAPDDAAADAVFDQHDETIFRRSLLARCAVRLGHSHRIGVVLKQDWQVDGGRGWEQSGEIAAMPAKDRGVVSGPVVGRKARHGDIES